MEFDDSYQFEPDMSPVDPEDMINPQLRQSPTKRSALSPIEGEPNVSPADPEDMIDPQLRLVPTNRSTLSSIEGEHTTSAADGHSIGNPTSNSEHDESMVDDEDVATGEDVAEDDQNTTQVHATVKTMSDVGTLATMHGDLNDMHAGFASYMQARRPLAIKNDDYAELVTHNSAYVRRVYTSITTMPASMTADQIRLVTLWGRKLTALGEDAGQYMADLASMVVAGVHALHTRGDHLLDAQFTSLKPHANDSTITATERIEIMCDILHNYKKHVIDIMSGFDAITKLVAAPKGIAKRKEDYKSNNDQKKRKKKELELEVAAKSNGEDVGQKKGGKKSGKKGGQNDNEDEYED